MDRLDRNRIKTFDPFNPAHVFEFRKLMDKEDTPEMHEKFGMFLASSEIESYAEEAIGHLEIAVDAGLADAAGQLGYMYFNGIGVEKDTEKGMDLYLDGAYRGSYESMFLLGNEYMRGTNVKADYGKAFDYLSESAEGGNDRAMNTLGVMYLCGYHVGKDVKMAKRLFLKSKARGNMNAAMNLILIDENGPDFDYKAMVESEGGTADYNWEGDE